jgi:hypothetical protein
MYRRVEWMSVIRKLLLTDYISTLSLDHLRVYIHTRQGGEYLADSQNPDYDRAC